MKRNMIIATALAVAGVATYVIRRNRNNNDTNHDTPARSHHVTNAFSKAKQHAMPDNM